MSVDPQTARRIADARALLRSAEIRLKFVETVIEESRSLLDHSRRLVDQTRGFMSTTATITTPTSLRNLVEDPDRRRIRANAQQMKKDGGKKPC